MKRRIGIINIVCILLISSALLGQEFEVYVSDGGDFNQAAGKILKFDHYGGDPEVFIEEEIAGPQDIVFLESREIVLVSNLHSGRITTHDIRTGEYIEDFAVNLQGPTGMKIGSDGLLYVLQWSGGGKVLRYKIDGTFIDPFTEIGIEQAVGLDWDTKGNLYVSSFSNGVIQKFNPEGEHVGPFIDDKLGAPTDIWFGDEGVLFVMDYNSGSIKRFDDEGQFIDKFIKTLSFPEGIAFLEDGDLLIGNGGYSSIRRYDASGRFKGDFIDSETGGLMRPNAVMVRTENPVATSMLTVPADFIAPTIGTEFYLSSSAPRDLRAVKVFDMKGHLVDSRILNNQLVWSAESIQNGLYILLIQSDDAVLFSQKVVVTK